MQTREFGLITSSSRHGQSSNKQGGLKLEHPSTPKLLNPTLCYQYISLQHWCPHQAADQGIRHETTSALALAVDGGSSDKVLIGTPSDSVAVATLYMPKVYLKPYVFATPDHRMCPLEPERRMRLSGPPTHRHMIKVVEASGTEASAHLHRSSRAFRCSMSPFSSGSAKMKVVTIWASIAATIRAITNKGYYKSLLHIMGYDKGHHISP